MRRAGTILLLFVFILSSCTSKTVPSPKEGATTVNSNSKTETNIAPDISDSYDEILAKPIKLEITKKPLPSSMLQDRGKLDQIPSYYKNDLSTFSVDFSGYDLRHLTINDSNWDALHAGSFNTSTKWPVSLPQGFNPAEIIEFNKKPGLGIKQLHDQGITGTGIGIAIIDQSLLVDHEEYKDQLRFYEELNLIEDEASMHGAAVASIAAGKTTGVAPDADLYYIAEIPGNFKGAVFEYDFRWLALAIDRLLAVNETLPSDRKIRVISISLGWDASQEGYTEVMEAIKRAKEKGIFVVSVSLSQTDGFMFHGIGQDWNRDPDDFNSYFPSSLWADQFYKYSGPNAGKKLLIPMDGITKADPSQSNGYAYYPYGGLSWAVPYIAGLYALACQAKKDLTPNEFWQLAMETGESVEIEKDGNLFKLERIVNPVRLLDKLQQTK